MVLYECLYACFGGRCKFFGGDIYHKFRIELFRSWIEICRSDNQLIIVNDDQFGMQRGSKPLFLFFL